MSVSVIDYFFYFLTLIKSVYDSIDTIAQNGPIIAAIYFIIERLNERFNDSSLPVNNKANAIT